MIDLQIIQQVLAERLSDYGVTAPLIFILLRAATVVVPPLPGIIVDLPGILVFGWLKGFLLAEVGIMSGAMAAFFIARKFREPAVKRFVSLQKLHRLENKISQRQEFWGFIALRLPTNILFDYISYAAGLSKMGAVKFFFATLLGNIPTVFLVYYFGGLSFEKGILYGISFLLLLIIIWSTITRKQLKALSKE